MLHFLLVPAVADAEQEAPAGKLVDRGDELRGLDGITLVDQADTGAYAQRLRCYRRGGEHEERIHDVVIRARQLRAAGERFRAHHGDVRVLRHPQQFEAALFEQRAEFAR